MTSLSAARNAIGSGGAVGAAVRSAAMPSVARDRVEPRLRQISFFLPNRLGALRRAVDLLESKDVRIAGISVLESADHAVVRLVVDRPDGTVELLTEAGYGTCITEILCVNLPPGPRFGIQRVLSVLLGAEVSITYLYGLILSEQGHPLLALKTDDLPMAERVLQRSGFHLLGQDDLAWPGESTASA